MGVKVALIWIFIAFFFLYASYDLHSRCVVNPWCCRRSQMFWTFMDFQRIFEFSLTLLQGEGVESRVSKIFSVASKNVQTTWMILQHQSFTTYAEWRSRMLRKKNVMKAHTDVCKFHSQQWIRTALTQTSLKSKKRKNTSTLNASINNRNNKSFF